MLRTHLTTYKLKDLQTKTETRLLVNLKPRLLVYLFTCLLKRLGRGGAIAKLLQHRCLATSAMLQRLGSNAESTLQ